MSGSPESQGLPRLFEPSRGGGEGIAFCLDIHLRVDLGIRFDQAAPPSVVLRTETMTPLPLWHHPVVQRVLLDGMFLSPNSCSLSGLLNFQQSPQRPKMGKTNKNHVVELAICTRGGLLERWCWAGPAGPSLGVLMEVQLDFHEKQRL